MSFTLCSHAFHSFHLHPRSFTEHDACPDCAKRRRDPKAAVPAPVNTFSSTPPSADLFGRPPPETEEPFSLTLRPLDRSGRPLPAKANSSPFRFRPPGMVGCPPPETANYFSFTRPPPSSQPPAPAIPNFSFHAARPAGPVWKPAAVDKDSILVCSHAFHLTLRNFDENDACPDCAKRQRDKKAGVPSPASVNPFGTKPSSGLFGRPWPAMEEPFSYTFPPMIGDPFEVDKNSFFGAHPPGPVSTATTVDSGALPQLPASPICAAQDDDEQSVSRPVGTPSKKRRAREHPCIAGTREGEALRQ